MKETTEFVSSGTPPTPRSRETLIRLASNYKYFHLVTSWMAFASLCTVPEVTPAIEMHPLRVM